MVNSADSCWFFLKASQSPSICLLKALEAEFGDRLSLSRRIQNKPWSVNDYLPNPAQTCRLGVLPPPAAVSFSRPGPRHLPLPHHSCFLITESFITEHHTHTFHHTLCPDSAEMTASQIIFGVISMESTPSPPNSQSHHTLLPSSSPQSISDFSFCFSPSVTRSHTLPHSVTSLTVNIEIIAFLSVWQSENNPLLHPPRT